MQVATPGLQAAHRYIWQFSQQLQQQAAGSGIVVQAAFENYTGSFDFDFVGERFVNGEQRCIAETPAQSTSYLSCYSWRSVDIPRHSVKPGMQLPLLWLSFVD